MKPADSNPVITVDGPGGSGKGTLSLKLAKALNFHFLDSGAIYRVLALKALWEKVDLNVDLEQENPENPEDPENPENPNNPKNTENILVTLAQTLNVIFKEEEKTLKMEILLDNHNVSQEIRSEICGNIASKIAVFPKVRASLLARQRAFSKPPGLVADGRDMGTVVFPEAFFKVFLTASPMERAKRRFLQLKEAGQDVNLQNLLLEIEERDTRDRERAVSPLKPAEDAWVVNTDGMGIEAVFEMVLTEFKRRFYKA